MAERVIYSCMKSPATADAAGGQCAGGSLRRRHARTAGDGGAARGSAHPRPARYQPGRGGQRGGAAASRLGRLLCAHDALALPPGLARRALALLALRHLAARSTRPLSPPSLP